MLERAVEVVDDAGVVAVSEHLRLGRCALDSHTSIGSAPVRSALVRSASVGVASVSVAAARIAVAPIRVTGVTVVPVRRPVVAVRIAVAVVRVAGVEPEREAGPVVIGAVRRTDDHTRRDAPRPNAAAIDRPARGGASLAAALTSTAPALSTPAATAAAAALRGGIGHCERRAHGGREDDERRFRDKLRVVHGEPNYYSGGLAGFISLTQI